jgi:hypothetical protein
MFEVLLHRSDALDLLTTASCSPCCSLPLSAYVQDLWHVQTDFQGSLLPSMLQQVTVILLLFDAFPEVLGSSCSSFIWQHVCCEAVVAHVYAVTAVLWTAQLAMHSIFAC